MHLNHLDKKYRIYCHKTGQKMSLTLFFFFTFDSIWGNADFLKWNFIYTRKELYLNVISEDFKYFHCKIIIIIIIKKNQKNENKCPQLAVNRFCCSCTSSECVLYQNVNYNVNFKAIFSRFSGQWVLKISCIYYALSLHNG